MPDGDNVHYKPKGRGLNQAYNMLLERRPIAEIAFKVESGLVALIRKYGNESRQLIDDTVDLIEAIRPQLADGKEYHPDEAFEKIIDSATHILGHRRGLPLAIDACKAYLLDFDPMYSSQEAQQLISEDYVWRIYDADFAESLPLYFHDPRTEMTQQDVDMSLADLRQEMKQHVRAITERFIRLDDVKRIKRAKRVAKDFDNDKDIFEGSL